MTQQDEIKLLSKLLFDKYEKVALNTAETAEAIGLSIVKVKKDRLEGIGLTYTKVARKVFYSVSDVAEFLVINKIKTMGG